MNHEQEIRINRLQENLMVLRKLAGWTAKDLGDLIGVTKQTISNLESGNTKMSLTQYIAIRAILDDEINRQADNDTLRMATKVLLDDNNLSEQEQIDLRERTKVYASAMKGKQNDAGLKLTHEAIFKAAAAAGIILSTVAQTSALGGAGWLKAIRSLGGKK